jgi:hypothetical protein
MAPPPMVRADVATDVATKFKTEKHSYIYKIKTALRLFLTVATKRAKNAHNGLFGECRGV